MPAGVRAEILPRMRPITPRDLVKLIAVLHASDEARRDVLLTDLLVVPYPTRITQDN